MKKMTDQEVSPDVIEGVMPQSEYIRQSWIVWQFKETERKNEREK